MFEEKIKLNPVKIDNIIEKEIYGQRVKFNKYLPLDYCKFIIDSCIDRFMGVNKDNKDFTTSIMSVTQTMNVYLCYLVTDIDMDNIAYEDLYAMGVFSAIEETLINYKEIKDTVMSCIGLMFNYFIYDAIEKLPTSKGMAENLSEIKEIFTSNPEKAKEFANIIIANHPELRGFGEIFEKILNNLNKKE